MFRGQSLLAAGILLAAFALSGCATVHKTLADQSVSGAEFQPRNYVGEFRLPTTIRRVVMLPVHGGEVASAETCEMLDPVLVEAMQNQARFEVVPMSREEFMKSFSVPDVSSASSLPHDFLTAIGAKYGAQAVLFVDLTAYHPYRPLSVGLRAKLATVADRRLIWSFDEIVSATDPSVVIGIRRFHRQTDLGPVPFDLTLDALQSPSTFAAYAADVMFRTLPRR